LKDRICKLEDDRFENMLRQISQIHECIYGNGKTGLKTIVEKNAYVLKGILWAVGIIYSAGISYVVVATIKLFTN